jgi:hypothetical protein
LVEFGVSGGYAVEARVKDQRLAIEAFVFLDFADEDQVVAAVVLLDEMSAHLAALLAPWPVRLGGKTRRPG